MRRSEWRQAMEKQTAAMTEQALQRAQMGVIRVMVCELTHQLTARCCDGDLLA